MIAADVRDAVRFGPSGAGSISYTTGGEEDVGMEGTVDSVTLNEDGSFTIEGSWDGGEAYTLTGSCTGPSRRDKVVPQSADVLAEHHGEVSACLRSREHDVGSRPSGRAMVKASTSAGCGTASFSASR